MKIINLKNWKKEKNTRLNTIDDMAESFNTSLENEQNSTHNDVYLDQWANMVNKELYQEPAEDINKMFELNEDLRQTRLDMIEKELKDNKDKEA